MELFTLLVFYLSFAARMVSCYLVNVDAKAEECFIEKVLGRDKLDLAYEVMEGGFLDIDLIVYDPSGNAFLRKDRETGGRFSFHAPSDGSYRYCFSNQMSSMTPKLVMFTMINENDAKQTGNQTEVTHGKLKEMVTQLGKALTGVRREQDYMEYRERIHRQISNRTNLRVLLWSAFEAVLMMTLAVGQVVYLKQFFEVRRVV